jgi:methylmalonyl-CoA mutase N-terminal domain/subunit
LRTQQIIAAESGVTNAVDPVGGSEAIEALTDSIERGALEYLERIAAMGGTLRAIESGYIQNEIQNAAFAWQQEVESGKRTVVGVNRFRMEEQDPIPTFRLDPTLEQAQVARLREVRAARSPEQVAESLARLEAAARGGENLMPRIHDAASHYATVGEIADRLRAVFGEYRETA